MTPTERYKRHTDRLIAQAEEARLVLDQERENYDHSRLSLETALRQNEPVSIIDTTAQALFRAVERLFTAQAAYEQAKALVAARERKKPKNRA